MADAPNKAERLAHNAILILIARGAMLCAMPLLVWSLKTLIDVQAQVAVLETRLSARIAAIEDRQGAQSRRMDVTDGRIDRLAEIANKFATDSAVLAERIRALLDGQQRRSP